jgi:hypothetical protein
MPTLQGLDEQADFQILQIRRVHGFDYAGRWAGRRKPAQRV